MEISKILGQRLRLLRKEKKQKQREIAALLEMTLRNYQRIEHGEINIPPSALCFFADYFGVTTDYLLGRSEER